MLIEFEIKMQISIIGFWNIYDFRKTNLKNYFCVYSKKKIWKNDIFYSLWEDSRYASHSLLGKPKI